MDKLYKSDIIFSNDTEKYNENKSRICVSGQIKCFFGAYTKHNWSVLRGGYNQKFSDCKTAIWDSYAKKKISEVGSVSTKRTELSEFPNTFGKIIFIAFFIMISISGLSNSRENNYTLKLNQDTPSSNSSSSLAEEQQLKSLLGNDSLAATAKIFSQTELYSNIQTPIGYPYGVKSYLKDGEMVEILYLFKNDTESKYTLKIKTNTGKVGYIIPPVKIINIYGERGDLLTLYLSLPYGYEGDKELVRKDIAKFRKFIDKYPNSSFIPEILDEIKWRNRYLDR
ncbi:MAG: hypothetical protein PF436_07740 [Prolixibacteraceae bacterium]|jgi:hypothetical protein|nr:hypothetical protein [Prolixibacteraceae bacterium]